MRLWGFFVKQLSKLYGLSSNLSVYEVDRE